MTLQGYRFSEGNKANINRPSFLYQTGLQPCNFLQIQFMNDSVYAQGLIVLRTRHKMLDNANAAS